MANSRLAPESPFGRYSDAAHRLSEAVTKVVDTHRADILSIAGMWMSFRLADGYSNGEIYPDQATAIRFVSDRKYYGFLKIPLEGMPPQEAESFLAFNRGLAANGFQMPDPDAHVHKPMEFGGKNR